MTHIVIVSGYAESLINFRGDLIRDLIARGCQVTAIAPTASPEQTQRIESLGAALVSYSVKRNRISLSADLVALSQLNRLFRQLAPDIVLAYTVKPVVWTGIALSGNRSTRFFPLITGLGFAFHGASLRRRVLKKLVTILYSRSLKRAEVVFFQNKDNQETFRASGILGAKPSVVLPGSGVNLERFPRRPLPTGNMVFLMIARLLGEKGVREFAEAAAKVKEAFPKVQFRLVGPFDSSPDGIGFNEVEKLKADGAIQFVGGVDDVRDELANCHVYVLPSYHEGLPRTVLEAMATGRPIITTNVPGCRETVLDNVNGFLVEPRNAESLAQKIIWFIENRDSVAIMGDLSHQIATQRFSVDIVNATMINRIFPEGLNFNEMPKTDILASKPSQHISRGNWNSPS